MPHNRTIVHHHPMLEEDPYQLMTPGEVAALFRVDPKTVSRWAKTDPPLLSSVLTPGGQRRYREREVREFLARQMAEGAGAPAAA